MDDTTDQPSSPKEHAGTPADPPQESEPDAPDDLGRPAIADESARPDESGTPLADDLGAGGD